jgi:hypothetical protein
MTPISSTIYIPSLFHGNYKNASPSKMFWTTKLAQASRSKKSNCIALYSLTMFLTCSRCSLALTLANAVLQLHDTPWLSEVWNTSDISILNNGWNPSLGEQPYVSTKFSSANGSIAAPLRRKKLRMIKNATIFALGVALLEISHGRRLSAFETPDDLDDQGKRTLWTDYLIADRLVEDIHRRELPNFANAAHRCVHCNFEGTVYSLNNDDFRERFHQGVILPLQRDYDYATGAGV